MNKLLSIAVSSMLLAGCAQFPVAFGDRAQYVVSTPEFADNRIYFVCKPGGRNNSALIRSIEAGNGSDAANDGADGAQANDTPPAAPDCIDEESYFSHGDGATIIVNSVKLHDWGSEEFLSRKRKDIAVVLDVDLGDGTGVQPIIVWYQRGVISGQLLNFSNLVISSKEQWDERDPPFFRIRLVDVLSEKNAEVRAFWSRAEEVGAQISSSGFLGLSTPLVRAANQLAKTALTTQGNEILLDYSFQLFPGHTIDDAIGTQLPPFAKGTYLLFGKNDETPLSLWNEKFSLNQLDGQIYLSDAGILNTPYVRVIATNGGFRVPAIIKARSDYLAKLLEESEGQSLERAQTEADLISKHLVLLAQYERFVSSLESADIEKLIVISKGMPEELQKTTVDIVRRMSRADVSTKGCSIYDLASAEAFIKHNNSKDKEIKWMKGVVAFQGGECAPAS